MKLLEGLKFLVIRILTLEPEFGLDPGRKQNVWIIKHKLCTFKPAVPCASSFTTIPGLEHVVN